MTNISTRLGAALAGIGLVALVLALARPSAQQQTATTAFVGGRLIDGTGRDQVAPATVVVSDGRITSAGAQSAVQIPAGASRIDLSGKTIMPGMINSHGHVDALQTATTPVRDQLLTQLRMYARYGVTTVFSLGDDGVETVRLRDEQETRPVDRARIYPAGPNVTAKTAEEGRQLVDRVAGMRVSIIKTRVDGLDNSPTRMPPDVYTAIIDQAHKRGLRVAAHFYYLKDARGLLDAGVDIMAHSVRDQEIDQTLIADMRQRGVGYIPTLAREVSVFVYETTPPFFKDPFFLRGRSLYGEQVTRLSDPAMQEKLRRSEEAKTIKQALVRASSNLKKLLDAGVPIAMGTDTGANLIGRWQGYFEHTELELMVRAGLTPMQALVAATGAAARVMKLDQLGTIEPGKLADLLVLNADPLADIRNTQKIDSVWIGGQRLSLAQE
jgi:imidazolonepropionase-like amidohydrolase